MNAGMPVTDEDLVGDGGEAARRPTGSEPHSGHSEHLNNIIIGFSDGLTVPFALTAGLSAAGSVKLVIMGGLAELFAGAISMGLGAWLAAETDRQHYSKELAREKLEVEHTPELEEKEVHDILKAYGIAQSLCAAVASDLRHNPDMWVKFMMDFELRLEQPNATKSWLGALYMGASYFMGGIVPMIPYFAMAKVNDALYVSIGISVVILLLFGYAKAHVTGLSARESAFSAVQTLVIGALAAATSYGIVRGLDSRFKVND